MSVSTGCLLSSMRDGSGRKDFSTSGKRRRGIEWGVKGGSSFRLGSAGQAKMTYGARPDAEIWALGVYCGVFLTERERMIQRRVARGKKAEEERCHGVSSGTSESSGSSDEYLPSR